MTTPKLELRWASSQDDLSHCYAVRWEVFVKEQAVPESLEIDDYDPIAHHLLALADNEIAGTARMMVDTPSPATVKIGRVAVLAKFRGKGLASQMMLELEAKAQAMGQTSAVLDSQLSVIPLYQNLGYEAYGPVFDDAGIDHRKMKKTF